MAWFGKKEDKKVSLPDLPEGEIVNFKKLPELPERMEVPDLPPLPDENPEDFSNPQFIKEVIDNNSVQKSNFEITPYTDSILKPISAVPANLVLKKTSKPAIEIPKMNFSEPKIQTDSGAKKSESVFVRLDKFQSSIETLEDIKKKIMDIERVLDRTKEIREKEEKEIEEWEREIHLIKSRLESIDKNLFERFD